MRLVRNPEKTKELFQHLFQCKDNKSYYIDGKVRSLNNRGEERRRKGREEEERRRKGGEVERRRGGG